MKTNKLSVTDLKEIFKQSLKDIYFIWDDQNINDIEDVKFNGSFFTIKYTTKKLAIVKPEDLEQTHKQIQSLVTKLDLKVNIVKRRTQETYKDEQTGLNIRLEFVSEVGNDYGCVFAMRFNSSNKTYQLYDKTLLTLIKRILNEDSVITIGGKTGSGKTSLQKLIIGYINDNEGIVLLEDTQDTSLKELYPNKDITCINIRDNVKFYESDLIHGFKTAKRFNPEWVILSEATDKILKKNLVETMLSSHKTITTIHNSNILETVMDLASAITTANDNSNDIELKVARNIGYFIYCNYKINENGNYIRYIDHISKINILNKTYSEEIIYKANISQDLKTLTTDKDVFELIDNKWVKKNEI